VRSAVMNGGPVEAWRRPDATYRTGKVRSAVMNGGPVEATIR